MRFPHPKRSKNMNYDPCEPCFLECWEFRAKVLAIRGLFSLKTSHCPLLLDNDLTTIISEACRLLA